MCLCQQATAEIYVGCYVSDSLSFFFQVSLCEKAIAEYTGHKYCVALNSCGSALALMLKAAGVQQGDKVLSNAFTFGAVPSAIEHAGGVAVYVESTEGYVMDVEDLEKKLKAKILASPLCSGFPY